MGVPAESVIIINIPRDSILSKDYGMVLNYFGEEAIADIGRLQSLHDTAIILVDGYNDTPAPLCVIPEVRDYFTGLKEVWPYWFFFCSLETDALRMMLLSVLSNFSARYDHQMNERFVIDVNAMRALVLELFGPMNYLYDLAGFSIEMNKMRSSAILDYLTAG
jgi:hypothetical protein